ncbi:hypothetical protein C8A01DRAFT_48092 [Parachaetomium inaequale]|uniref:adenosine deaminase n=1 Tax=Parachaetomium inaequale TaxID=2588326 RepID=A0AAN6PC77_9PEZI|nr:hypothetical protein C8A01DRAFT_48092 [Parachaetomium inaequale]
MAPVTDEEWADLVAHEIPKTSDPALSPIANHACDIVSKIRHEETRSARLTTPKETAKSWQIIRRMPKGALLRAHCHSLVDIDHLIKAALSTPGMCISCPNGHLATQHAGREGRLRIQFRAKPDSDDGSFWNDNYKPGTFIALSKAAADYPEGGRQGFLEWLRGRCGISTQDSNPRESRTASPVRSEDVSGMLYYEPIWRAFLQRLMTALVEDGVYWLELRLTFPLAYYREGSESPDPDHDHLFQAIGEEVARFQATDPGRQFWGLRVVWSTMRGQDPRSIIEDADNCISAKLLWPQLVAGYDLAGPENLGRPLADLLPELFWFRKQCALEDVQIPFFLRAGGSLGDAAAAATETNLFDALLLGTRRIGNAVALHRHPRLVEAIKDKRILVEAFPASNDGPDPIPDSVMHHPLPALLAQGVSCALCDDDSGILSSKQDGGPRMTNIFWHAFQTWDSTDLATLGSLAENSVRWAAFEDQDSETCAREGIERRANEITGLEGARQYGDAFGDGSDGDTDPAE